MIQNKSFSITGKNIYTKKCWIYSK